MAEIHFYNDEEKQNEIYPAIDPAGVYPTTTVGFSNNLVSSSKIVSETKFNYRNTGGNENVLDGIATIDSIRGSVDCTTIKEQCTIEVISSLISATVDVSVFRTSIANTEGEYIFYFEGGVWNYNSEPYPDINRDYGINVSGNPAEGDQIIVHFIPKLMGNITIAKPTKLKSVIFNQFDKNGNNILLNRYIDANGDVKSGTPQDEPNTYGIIWFECVGNNTYTIYDDNEYAIYRVAWSASIPTSSSRGLRILSQETTAKPGKQILNNLTYLQYYTPEANGYLCIVPTYNVDKLCCHLTCASDEDTSYQDYAEDEFNFDIEYTIKDSNNNTIFANGLLQVENYYDEINYKTGEMYKRIKRDNNTPENIQRMEDNHYPYIFNEEYIYYYDGDILIYHDPGDLILNKNTNYRVGTEGSERFIGTQLEIPLTIQYPLNLKSVIQEIVKNKINILNIQNGSSESSLRNINSIEESNSYTIGKGAFAEGENTKVTGNYSHAEGFATLASSDYQHVEGKYNIEDNNNRYAHIIGNGIPRAPSNLHTIDWNGDAWFKGNVYIQSTNGTNRDTGSKKLLVQEDIPAIHCGTIEPQDNFGSDGDLFILINS